jgi:hypothetical protein
MGDSLCMGVASGVVVTGISGLTDTLFISFIMPLTKPLLLDLGASESGALLVTCALSAELSIVSPIFWHRCLLSFLHPSLCMTLQRVKFFQLFSKKGKKIPDSNKSGI